jgi:GH25 family lysozyme M1 (1,4-beta-N-acetylmuramidase)
MEDYGFHVTWEKLGSQRPTHDLNHYLSKFIWEHGHKNALLIIYYAGHGVYANNSIQWQP